MPVRRLFRSRPGLKWGLLGFVLLGAAGGLALFGPNVRLSMPGYLYIPTGATAGQVVDSLEAHNVLRSVTAFELLAAAVGYESRVHPGRYSLEPGMSTFALVRNLAGGRQSPVRVQFPPHRDFDHLLERIAAELQISADELRFELYKDSTLARIGFTKAELPLFLLPNTYELYWNATPRQVIDKLAQAQADFWTETRRTKALRLGLTPREVGVLASIVEAETQYGPEKARIAGVYLNRLRKGMKLQADPTVLFALGDWSVRRVRASHLKRAANSNKSAYSTYANKGLPPGPILTPSAATLDAVLNAEAHSYLYFVAATEHPGRHAFSTTYAEHRRKAKAYQQALDERGL